MSESGVTVLHEAPKPEDSPLKVAAFCLGILIVLAGILSPGEIFIYRRIGALYFWSLLAAVVLLFTFVFLARQIARTSK